MRTASATTLVGRALVRGGGDEVRRETSSTATHPKLTNVFGVEVLYQSKQVCRCARPPV